MEPVLQNLLGKVRGSPDFYAKQELLLSLGQ